MSTLPLEGRHVVVTGAGRGIGASIVAKLAQTGASITLMGRTQSTLDETAARDASAVKTFTVTTDVADVNSVKSAFDQARRKLGPVHILINNAGQAGSSAMHKMEDSLWHSLIGINLTGSYYCIRQALPDMLAEKWGRIVNVASTAGLRGGAYLSAYSASKHGLIGLTRSLALEVADKNITVNAVCPTYVRTDIVTNAVTNIVNKAHLTEEQAMASLVKMNPQKRLIEPEEVAHAVVWLCLPGAESINGVSVPMSGGEVT